MNALMKTTAATVAAALLVRAATRRAEQSSAPGRFIEVDGVRLHYVEAGEGPPLVLLHGLGSMVEDFLLSGLVKEASARYRVIAIDRPGYGRSERPRGMWGPMSQARLLKNVLEKLQVQRPILLGHSWGTLVAIAYALQNPGAVRSLVLASGLYFPTLRLDAPLLVPPAIPVIGTLMRHTLSPLLGRALWPAWLRLLFSPCKVPQRFLDYFPAGLAVRPSQLLAVAQEAFATLPATRSMAPRYPELTVPTVFVCGNGDRYVDPEAHTARLHRLLPAARLLRSPHAGHMVHHSDLGIVLQALDVAAWPG
jgi:pimeloyl-ACP methyl ester carboxylesterase